METGSGIIRRLLVVAAVAAICLLVQGCVRRPHYVNDATRPVGRTVRPTPPRPTPPDPVNPVPAPKPPVNPVPDPTPAPAPHSSEAWTAAELAKANTAADVDYLTDVEKQALMYTNLARLDGQKFLDICLNEWMNGPHNYWIKEDNPYVRSLRQDLAKVKNRTMLQPNPRLAEAADVHAADLGPTGHISHDSTDGTPCFERISRYYYANSIGENIASGDEDPLTMICLLLIDSGVESLGHRKNIVSVMFNEVGIGYAPMPGIGYVMVQDFGGSITGTRLFHKKK